MTRTSKRVLVIVAVLCSTWTTTGCDIDAQQINAILQIAGAFMQQVGQSGVVDQFANASQQQAAQTGQTGTLVASAGQGFGLPVANDPQAQDKDGAVQQASRPQIDTASSAESFEPVSAD